MKYTNVTEVSQHSCPVFRELRSRAKRMCTLYPSYSVAAAASPRPAHNLTRNFGRPGHCFAVPGPVPGSAIPDFGFHLETCFYAAEQTMTFLHDTMVPGAILQPHSDELQLVFFPCNLQEVT